MVKNRVNIVKGGKGVNSTWGGNRVNYIKEKYRLQSNLILLPVFLPCMTLSIFLRW